MSIKWTHELELMFLERYQCYPIIWDPKHRDHKDRNKVHDAWNEISGIMNIPIKELKSKKDSLMSTYRMHKRKIKSSEQSGAGTDDIYSPIWFAFDLMDSFLGNDNTSNKTKNTITIQETDPSQDDRAVTPESANEARNIMSDESTPGPSNASQTIRRRKNPPELMEAGKTMNKALNTLNEVLNQRSASTSAQQEDECDLYGRMLAKKLRKFPEHERVNVMYELDGTIIRLLSRNTSHRYVTIPSPLSAHSSNSESIFLTNTTRPYSSQTSYSEPITRYYFEDRPLSTPASSYYISSPQQLSQQQSQQHLPQQHQSQQHLPQQHQSQQHLSQQQQSQQDLPQQHQSQQHLSQQQQSQQDLPQQHLPQQQQSQQHLPQQQQSQQQSQQVVNYNTNIQYPPVIHIPDQPSSSNPSLESTQNDQDSIQILSDFLILPSSKKH